MADPFLLIDGYNLMHAAGMFRESYGPGEFEKWRNRFLEFVSDNLTDAERRRTTVVFDAPASSVHAVSEWNLQGLRVMFAQSDLDADDVIEELIAGHSAPRQILLISSDHRLQRAARKRRGRFVDSEVFASRLAERRDAGERQAAERPPPQKFRGLQSDRETAAWLELFGEIPEAGKLKGRKPKLDLDDLQREVDAESE